ncbi:MAG TPA: hypothetical protein VL325_02735 [Pyrinomonadaceae bacterium]|nr:hypothetical protein [Pyrinomonadaceae bacterium]
MIESLPGYISITFILTTFLTVGILFYAVKRSVFDSIPAKILIFLMGFWLLFQAAFALGGSYQAVTAPPRVVLFGVAPALLLIIAFFIFARESFVERLPLKILTILHVVRIPVELVLLWLFQQGLEPRAMTFEGSNFDILSGLTAPVVYFFAFRGGRINRPLLIVWNIAALLLLVNVVIIAILSFPGPMQRIALDQPNIGVTYFPFIWLPSVVVPTVLFCHLASLWQLFRQKE